METIKNAFRWFLAEDDDARVRRRYATVPNAITITGFAAIALYVWFFVAEVHSQWIPWIVIFIGVGDLLDGAAARVLDQHTYFGKIIDPLRDRLFALAIVVHMLRTEPSFSVAMLVLALLTIEVAIIGIRTVGRIRLGGRLHTHAIAKGRVAVHLLVAGVFIAKTYWLEALENWLPAFIAGTTVTQLLLVMLVASICTAWMYARKALP